MFTWDARKALQNLRKHRVSFEEAATVFADSEALDWEDTEHSEFEKRSKRLGKSFRERALLVVYTVRRLKNEKETVRIISARQASRKERKAYAGQPD
ncbi:MAG: BrnT family toxin [Candidatus Acidiferrales bacterium]